MKKSNQLNIGRHMIYTVETLAEKIDVNKKTIFRWVEEGLMIVPGSEGKIMMEGREIIKFIRERQKSKRMTLDSNEFYCMTCKCACRAKRGTIKTVDNVKVAKCRKCNGNISKIFKQLKKGL